MSAEERLKALQQASPDGWVALSGDESRVVAYGQAYLEVVERAKGSGEEDPVLIKCPKDWSQRIFAACA